MPPVLGAVPPVATVPPVAELPPVAATPPESEQPSEVPTKPATKANSVDAPPAAREFLIIIK
jgi:hypothetical protein